MPTQAIPTINNLGVTFSSYLTCKDHITNLTKLGSRRLAALRRLSGFFNPSQLLSVYRGLVRPCGVQFKHTGWFHPYCSTGSPGVERNSSHCLSFSHYLFNSPMYSPQCCLSIPFLQILLQPVFFRTLKLCPSTPPEVSQYPLLITRLPFFCPPFKS